MQQIAARSYAISVHLFRYFPVHYEVSTPLGSQVQDPTPPSPKMAAPKTKTINPMTKVVKKVAKGKTSKVSKPTKGKKVATPPTSNSDRSDDDIP